MRGITGRSCLTIACNHGHLELIKWLVNEKGCFLDETDENGTCIINAARNKHIECVVWMLHNGSSTPEKLLFSLSLE